MATDGQTYLLEQQAQRLQAQADSLTEFREKEALVTGPVMAIYGPSWPLAIAEVIGGLSDWLDGHLAKKAEALVGHAVNPDGKDNDRDADKLFTYSGMIGTIVRDIVDGHPASGLFVGGVTIVSAARDNAIQKARADSSKNESSILINRVGTVIRIGSICIGMSPFGKTDTGRRVRNVSLGAGTVLAGIGYFKTKRQLKDN